MIGGFRAYAHRGGSQVAPENSPAAFASAVALGYVWLETDLRATRDGIAVVHHDPDLDRTTDLSGPVLAQAWRDVSRARFANGENPLRLDELLEAYPDARFNLDVKEPAVVVPTLDTLRRANAWHRVCLTSFSTLRLRAVRRWVPHPVETSAGPLEVLLHRTTPLPFTRLLRSTPDRLQVPTRLVTSTFIRRAHARGLAVDAWTVNDAGDMKRLLALGVDGIMTDDPALLRDVVRSHGGWWPDAPPDRTRVR